MKLYRKVFIVTFILLGIMVSRERTNAGTSEIKLINGDNKQHYYFKDCAYQDDNQLDRKRSHKRRRKIRKPIKGLR